MGRRVFPDFVTAAVAVEQFANGMANDILSAMRVEQKAGATRARETGIHASAQTEAIHQRLLARGAGLKLKYQGIQPRYSQSGGQYLGGLRAKGLAGHMETGGRFRKYWVYSRRGKKGVLVLRLAGGKVIRTKGPVHAGGGRVLRAPVLAKTLNEIRPLLARRIDAALRARSAREL